MLDTQNISNSKSSRRSRSKDEIQEASAQLQSILTDYLDSRPHLSLNGLAKRCTVSEPTLRRIKKGQLKTLPEVSTIIDLLMYISQERNARKIPQLFPGPLAEYLKSKTPQIDAMVEIEVSESLTQSLKDPVKYLIYKLSVNTDGVSMDKVVEMFGSYGEKQIQELLQENLLELKDGCYYGKVQNFCLSHSVFVKHFKATADYIKPEKSASAPRNLSPIFKNYSTGLNKKAYAEILKIQKQALKKILKVMVDKNSEGPIPAFYLAALDTLDHKSADEF